MNGAGLAVIWLAIKWHNSGRLSENVCQLMAQQLGSRSERLIVFALIRRSGASRSPVGHATSARPGLWTLVRTSCAATACARGHCSLASAARARFAPARLYARANGWPAASSIYRHFAHLSANLALPSSPMLPMRWLANTSPSMTKSVAASMRSHVRHRPTHSTQATTTLAPSIRHRRRPGLVPQTEMSPNCVRYAANNSHTSNNSAHWQPHILQPAATPLCH